MNFLLKWLKWKRGLDMISDIATLINNKDQSAESYSFLLFVNMEVKSIMINTT